MPCRVRVGTFSCDGGEKTKKLCIAWLVMWALSYLLVAVIAPGIGGSPIWESSLLFLAFGIALFTAIIFVSWSSFYLKQTLVPNTVEGTKAAKNLGLIGRIMLIILAMLSVYSGVASWTGVALWVVPFANKEVFQVSMAFADLIGAAFMLDLALEA